MAYLGEPVFETCCDSLMFCPLFAKRDPPPELSLFFSTHPVSALNDCRRIRTFENPPYVIQIHRKYDDEQKLRPDGFFYPAPGSIEQDGDGPAQYVLFDIDLEREEEVKELYRHFYHVVEGLFWKCEKEECATGGTWYDVFLWKRFESTPVRSS